MHVVADFTNTTGDAVFDDTLKTALAVSLNQSPFLNVLSESKVAGTLKLMTQAPDVVEVHNGQNNYGPMWYHVGQQNPSTGAVTWGPSYNYGNGYNPTVAISGTTVVEVHNGQLGYGPMWYHVGHVNGSTITWGPRYGFGSGYNPTIALAPYQGTIVNRDCLLAIEAHNSSSSTTANMYYKVGPVGSVSEKPSTEAYLTVTDLQNSGGDLQLVEKIGVPDGI